MSPPDTRIQELHLTLPPAPKPMAKYRPAVLVGNMLYLSGHGPLQQDGTLIKGRVGGDLTVEQGYAAAKQTGLAILSTVKNTLGTLNKVKRLVKTFGLVQCTPEFNDQPKDVNGFSELMAEVFGEEAGVGARSAVGTSALPVNMAVEVECIFEINRSPPVATGGLGSDVQLRPFNLPDQLAGIDRRRHQRGRADKAREPLRFRVFVAQEHDAQARLGSAQLGAGQPAALGPAFRRRDDDAGQMRARQAAQLIGRARVPNLPAALPEALGRDRTQRRLWHGQNGAAICTQNAHDASPHAATRRSRRAMSIQDT